MDVRMAYVDDVRFMQNRPYEILFYVTKYKSISESRDGKVSP